VSVVALVSKGASSKLPAGAWIKPVLESIGAKGGGSPVQAQGQGTRLDALDESLKTANTVAAGALA
jgi:alanyl-tRNA synthetase